MTLYACVIDGTIRERKNWPKPQPDAPHKRLKWLPVEVVGDDSFDSDTHKKTGPVTTVEATRVVDTFSIVPLSSQELDDRKESKVDRTDPRLLLKMLLVMHNEIRVLKGLVPNTMRQFKNEMKALD
jgi:hypothetical protein